MEIRKLTETDYEQFIRLYLALDELHVQARPDYFVHRSGDEACPRDAYLESLTDPAGLELGVFAGEELVGFALATLSDESGMVKGLKNVCLDAIYVLPAHRRKGIGAKLFARVETWAREQGAARLDLYTWDFNKDAIALYRVMGMTPQQHVFEKAL